MVGFYDIMRINKIIIIIRADIMGGLINSLSTYLIQDKKN